MTQFLPALAAGLAVFAAGLAVIPGTLSREPLVQVWARYRRLQGHRLRAARVDIDPHRYALVGLFLPPVLAALGLLLSPVAAAGGLALGWFAPRAHLSWMSGWLGRRAEADAGRLLSALTVNLGAGTTYYDAIQQAHAVSTDRWLREDLALLLAQFNLDSSMAAAVRQVRQRTPGRNLGLLWDQLAICLDANVPPARAKVLLADLAGSVQFNEQLQREVHARTSGQRAQIWILALVVPALYFYLRLVSPDLLSMLDENDFGRYVLVPAGAVLEVTGIWLSLRLSRVEV